MPVNAIVLVRKAAPARMNMIMQLVRVAPISPSQNVAQVSDLLHQASPSEPTTP